RQHRRYRHLRAADPGQRQRVVRRREGDQHRVQQPDLQLHRRRLHDQPGYGQLRLVHRDAVLRPVARAGVPTRPDPHQPAAGATTAVSRLVLKLPPSTAWATRTQTLSVLGSTDGSTYTTIAGSANYTFDPATANTVTIRFTSTSRRYLRLNFTANTGWPAGQL